MDIILILFEGYLKICVLLMIVNLAVRAVSVIGIITSFVIYKTNPTERGIFFFEVFF